MQAIKKSLPWWCRLAAKLVLARLRIPYSVWKALGLFEHGHMNNAEYAIDTFMTHARTANVLSDERLTLACAPELPFVMMEIGPGDSVATAVIGAQLGASKTWLIDSGPFATSDPSYYSELLSCLEARGIHLRRKIGVGSLEELLDHCSACYLVNGVSSLAEVPTESVSFCFSNAVLEHVPKGDFTRLTSELFRISRPGGICVHRIDLKDHLGGSLNNLRFAERLWEGSFFSTSGFYTNRLRLTDIRDAFESAGFVCSFPRIERWQSLPISRSQLDAEFGRYSDEELLVCGFDIVARKP